MNAQAQRIDGAPMRIELDSAANLQTPRAPWDRPILQSYLRMMRRWRWVIVGAIVACVALALVVTMLMTPKYTAVSTIEISRESDKVTDFQGVEREATAADQEFYQTQYGLLQSRTLAERVANNLRLVDDPKFYDMFGESGGDRPSLALVNGRFNPATRADRQFLAGQILLDNVEVVPARLSRLVDIRFTSPDAPFSAKVTNAWSDGFIETNFERKVQASSNGREVLQRQLAEYKQRLDESQRQLVEYAAREQIINLPSTTSADGSKTQERSLVADDLGALNAALNQATADRIAAESRVQRSGGAGASALALNNTAINNLRQRRAELAAQYQQLMVRFEPGYPAAQAIQSQIDQLDRSIGREESRVTGTVQAEYQQSLAREQALQARVNRLKGDFLDQRKRSIQYNIFQQEVDTNQALYDGLLQRFKEIGVAAGVGVNNISIVDAADVPVRPSSPRLLLNLLLGLVAGLGLGALLAYILEQLDEAIADPGEMERRLGLPLLGTVPRLVDSENPIEALQDRKSELVDAYLAIQTNLAFTTEHGVPATLSVTSTRPAEGKSTTALALAVMLSRNARKVILVDGDMRSPSVHHFGSVGHERGLSNYLAGDDAIDLMTFRMEQFGFDAMSAGPIPPNAAELLTGHRLNTLIELLRTRYDHVIVDSPPVMGLADALLIASRVEGVIYAVESHGIRSTQVHNALGRLRSSNARIFGGVLTKFEARKADYGYEYGYGYGREAEQGSA